jgi:phosphoribosylamine--glycine ligase
MSVLVVGSGGREHALAWKLGQSPRVDKVYVAPGNGGTYLIANAENVTINATDTDRLVAFAREKRVGLTVVGPDNALALGIVDAFQACKLRIFGPTQAAAEIESSKVFAKGLMCESGIPTAEFCIFREYSNALAYVRAYGTPIVIKASGLALGKGVYVCETLEQSEEALRKIMIDRVHQEAGDEVIVEKFLDGQEISIHVFCDGKTYAFCPPSQDHKPIGDGDKGKNTGGMGTVAPLSWVSPETMREVETKVVRPTLEALANLGRPFIGLLYPGLKMTRGGLKVLEFNARFGDSETQTYMRLLKTDLLDILEACVDGTLSDITLEWYPGFAVCIVLVSGGYPDEYEKHIPIYGLAEAEKIPGVVVFHAGTVFEALSELRTSGGRVLGVTAIGETLHEALDRAYEAVALIHFDGMQYRRDIGAKAFAIE